MTDVIFFTNQKEFADWLENNSEASEIWVGYFKKKTKIASLTWSESVDVALCFGWIDGIRKFIDESKYKIRFTPRKINSDWSLLNVEKAKELIKLGKMKPLGLKLFNSRENIDGYHSGTRNLKLDFKYEEKIKQNQMAWNFFENLALSYKRDSIYWVMSAKKEETQLKRLSSLISSCEMGLKIPMLRKNKN